MSTNTPPPTALVPLSDHPFYLWQMLVQWTHLRDIAYPAQYLIYTGASGPSAVLRELMAGMGARIAVWHDWRRNPRYNPAMKPGLVGRWLEAHPNRVDQPFLLLDPDAIPLPAFTARASSIGLTPDPGRWIGTDTDAYTGPEYLKSKGEDLWGALCELVGVDPAQAAEHPGRGSQVVFTGHPARLWLEIADLSEQAYSILTAHPSDVQTWCAEMYVTQLVAARERIRLDTRASMRMVWAGGSRTDWGKAGFYHNAGITQPDTGHFWKGAWADTPPFGRDIDGVKDTSASARYVDLIRRTETEFPELCRALTRG